LANEKQPYLKQYDVVHCKDFAHETPFYREQITQMKEHRL